MQIRDRKVFLTALAAVYPKEAPFHPSENYPEFQGAEWASLKAEKDNFVYEGIRDLLKKAYPDAQGNYLSAVIKPGDRVVIKPNLVKACHEKNDEWEQVITHGSVLRAVVDYVILALKGEGEVVIAEAPQTDTSFSEAASRSGIADIVKWYEKTAPVKVTLLDLRKEEWLSKDGITVKRTDLAGDPLGYRAVDLASESAFSEVEGKDASAPLYGADYDLKETAAHHSNGRHEYLLAETVLLCDVIINLPKLKTHKKTGLTCAMKNLVGINGDKNWLPHYRMGSPEAGGDQFKEKSWKTKSERGLVTFGKNLMYRLPAWLNEIFRPIKALGRLVYGDTSKTVRSGNWYGNDTCWRMVWDLNKALLKAARARSIITITDAVIAGEGDGPLAPDRKECGWLALGEDPQSLDKVLAFYMGFDAGKIAYLMKPLSSENKECEVVFTSENAKARIESTPPFRPHFGWVGKIELPADTKNSL
ncbi:DUF362 domain-containing protein [bacterium]|nr:DUF362 domain-containing protein [bacterium]